MPSLKTALKHLIGLFLVLAAVCSTVVIPSTTWGGGLDGGGNGVFIETPSSPNLVFYDLFINDSKFSDSQLGDQIAVTSSHERWVDYRGFKSFALLKKRLTIWSQRAKNLTTLLEGTDLAGFPGAYYNFNSRVFLNVKYWNRAGIISQAALLLHERLRTLQFQFSLTNDELQRLVFMIMTQDPANAHYDDGRFSKSWTLLHPSKTPTNFNSPVIGEQIESLFWNGLFDCTTNISPPTCMKALGTKWGQPAFPEVPPEVFINSSKDVEDAISAGVLGEKDPGPVKLVSTGINNQPDLVLPNHAPFSNMYGVYDIIDCKNLSTKPSPFALCTYKEFSISPMADKPEVTTLMALNSPSFAIIGWYAYSQSGWAFKTEGDKLASAELSVTAGDVTLLAKITIVKSGDGTYSFHYIQNNPEMRDEYQLTLRKK